MVEVALADPGADTTALREMGERVLAGCDEQARVIDALLDLDRCRCAERRCEPIDLAAIAAAGLRTHDPGGLEQVVTLEPAWTTGHAELLGRLAANLVSNAIRHNCAGGRIEVATRAEPGGALLVVANTGPTIPHAHLERLFQPFQRLETGRSDGVGLGLAIVRAIAEAHGATVAARARTGGGLALRVCFPAASSARAEGEAAAVGVAHCASARR